MLKFVSIAFRGWQNHRPKTFDYLHTIMPVLRVNDGSQKKDFCVVSPILLGLFRALLPNPPVILYLRLQMSWLCFVRARCGLELLLLARWREETENARFTFKSSARTMRAECRDRDCSVSVPKCHPSPLHKCAQHFIKLRRSYLTNDIKGLATPPFILHTLIFIRGRISPENF